MAEVLERRGRLLFLEANLRELAIASHDFRRVIATGLRTQIITISLSPNEEIGSEMHPVSEEILFIVSGTAKAVVDEKTFDVRGGDAILLPAGSVHNLTNTGSTNLAVITIASPPQFPPDAVQRTKTAALSAQP